MNKFSIRWKNFRSLKDTGWIDIRPLTIIIGANATGKTSLLAPLLILKQTVESSDPDLALKTIGEYFDAGSFENLIWSHDCDKPLELSIRFRRHQKDTDTESDERSIHLPGEVSFQFGLTEDEKRLVLTRYVVRDVHGKIILSRKRLKSGRYSISGLAIQSKGKGFHSLIRSSSPEGFLFTAESAFRERIKETIKAKSAEDKKGEFKISLELRQPEDVYLSTVSFVKSFIGRLLREISYIGPLSASPKRMYELSGEKPENVGKNGEFAPEVLYRNKDSEIMKAIDKWISVFDLGSHISCNTLSDGVFNVTLCRGKKSPDVNIADTGFGLSQVLPIIAQGFYSESNSLIISEQPEVHLNPRIQSLLADVFCDITSNGVGVLVETHSEHLLLRLRRLIAEKKIDTKDVAIYYAERDNNESKIRKIAIDETGHIDPKEWPSGFFEDSLKESLGLAAAQVNLGSNG